MPEARPARLLVALLLAAILAALVPAGTAHADEAAPPAPEADVYLGRCTLLACETYASRSYTRLVLAPAAGPGATGYTAVVTGMCVLSGVGAAAAAGCASYAGFMASLSAAAIAQAAANNQCAVLVSEQLVQVLSWFRTDNGSRCVD